MPRLCKICMKRAAQWDGDTLDEHIKQAHHDEPESVKEVYPDRYDSLFDDGEISGSSSADMSPSSDQTPAHQPETTPDPSPEPEPEPAPASNEMTQDAPGDGVDLHDASVGKKWFMIGVGGAGNNILDAVLLRRDTLTEINEPRSRIWQGGLAGYGILNTNLSELEQTYYAQGEQGYSRHDLLTNCIIGLGEHDYTGAGHRWDIGKKLMEADFTNGGDPFSERLDMNPSSIKDSQGVMFIHSVTKGTGCGATPVLARNMRDRVLGDDQILQKPLFSSIVVPSEGVEYSQHGGSAKVNGVIGLARASKEVDAIIPFNNQQLRKVEADIRPQINGIEEYNPPQYQDINRPLVAFLEAFTMPSTPQFLDREATMSIVGEVFDPSDSFRPVKAKYPADPERDYTPAVILAPVLGRSRSDQFDLDRLEILIRNALFQNKLADFDPTTAWGGTFLLYGPEHKMEQISEYVTDGKFTELLANEQFLDAAHADGAEPIDIHVHQLVSPHVDDVYLWGTLWNPKMPSLTNMYEHAQTLKEDAATQQAENIRDVWDHVEALFSHLGRENLI